MKIVNDGLPQPLYDAIANDSYSRGEADISVTQLISPPRVVELLRLHDSELEENASDRIYSVLGQGLHTVLERASKTGLAEERLFIEVNGWKISGQVDRMDGTTIIDYKTASTNEMIFGVKAERESQLNCYAHLARLNGYEVKKLEAVFILRDWSKVRAANDPSYPQKQVVVHELPLWSPFEAECFIRDRVTLHQAARVSLPECSDEERWQRAGKWAVMKKGAKRAYRLCDWEAEANVLMVSLNATTPGKPYSVSQRPGEATRCLHFCSASTVCSQWAAISSNTESE